MTSLPTLSRRYPSLATLVTFLIRIKSGMTDPASMVFFWIMAFAGMTLVQVFNYRRNIEKAALTGEYQVLLGCSERDPERERK